MDIIHVHRQDPWMPLKASHFFFRRPRRTKRGSTQTRRIRHTMALALEWPEAKGGCGSVDANHQGDVFQGFPVGKSGDFIVLWWLNGGFPKIW